jgi:cation diffusion facilitator CzcD-associated flavoprotein CzcO
MAWIPGRESFKSDMLHTASWPKKYDFTGQTVSLIGNGSSGVQVLPHIVEQAEKVYVHMRNGSWFTVGFASKFGGPGGSNVDFTEEQKDAWTKDPEEYFRYRKLVEQELNARFKTNLRGSKEQALARDFCLKEMSRQLASRPDLLKALTPDFPVG